MAGFLSRFFIVVTFALALLHNHLQASDTATEQPQIEIIEVR